MYPHLYTNWWEINKRNEKLQPEIWFKWTYRHFQPCPCSCLWHAIFSRWNIFRGIKIWIFFFAIIRNFVLVKPGVGSERGRELQRHRKTWKNEAAIGRVWKLFNYNWNKTEPRHTLNIESVSCSTRCIQNWRVAIQRIYKISIVGETEIKTKTNSSIRLTKCLFLWVCAFKYIHDHRFRNWTGWKIKWPIGKHVFKHEHAVFLLLFFFF